MPPLKCLAEHLARRLLSEDAVGLRVAEWTVEAVELLLEADDLEVDHDLTLAAAWAISTMGASFWPDDGDGYQVEDVRRDLGDGVARIVAWLVPCEWQDRREHLHDLVSSGPEVRVVALAQAMVRVVLAEDMVAEHLNEAVFLLAMATMPSRALSAAGWPLTMLGAEA